MSGSATDTRSLVAWTIDDSEFDVKLNQRILKRSGVFSEVHGFLMVRDALEEMRRTRMVPDVIFLDIMMPLDNGFDFLTEATHEFGTAFTSSVVFMLTSSLNPADRARAEGFEAVRGFLSKPLTIEDGHHVAAAAAGFRDLKETSEQHAIPN